MHIGDGRNRVLKGQVELNGIYLELVLIGPVLETRVLVMRSSWEECVAPDAKRSSCWLLETQVKGYLCILESFIFAGCPVIAQSKLWMMSKDAWTKYKAR